MKKAEIRGVLEALKKVKVYKIENVELRDSIIKTHLFLLRKAKEFDEEIANLRVAHLGSYSDELTVVSDLETLRFSTKDPVVRESLKVEIDSHKDALEALKSFGKAAEELGKGTFDVQGFPVEAFVEEYSKQEYDMAVIEALYPVLVWTDNS